MNYIIDFFNRIYCVPLYIIAFFILFFNVFNKFGIQVFKFIAVFSFMIMVSGILYSFLFFVGLALFISVFIIGFYNALLTFKNALSNNNNYFKQAKPKFEPKILDCYYKFKEILEAYMDMNTIKLKSLLSEELFKKYSNNIKELESNFRQYIIESISFIEGNIIESNDDIVKIRMTISFKEYIIDIKTYKAIEGDKNTITSHTYYLTFKHLKNENNDIILIEE